jgi:hypothetical protein
MVGLVVVVIATILAGICVGGFLRLSSAICREDRRKGSLRVGAPDRSAEAARALVGINGSGWR